MGENIDYCWIQVVVYVQALYFSSHIPINMKIFLNTIFRVYYRVKYRFGPASCFYTALLNDILEVF